MTSSETVAVIELVKNAYDADATRVLVRFQGLLEIGQGRIEVMDNGQGMSLETLQTTWMEPATLFRKRQQHSEQYGRRVLGEKGIGRSLIGSRALAAYGDVDGSFAANNRPWSRKCITPSGQRTCRK